MSKTQKQLLESQTYVDPNQQYSNDLNSENKYVSEPIDGTPFRAVKNQEGWFLAFQDQRISSIFNDRDELTRKVLINIDWITICTLIAVICEKVIQNQNQK